MNIKQLVLSLMTGVATVVAQPSVGFSQDIIGGHNATEGAWPFMATLFSAGGDPANPSGGHFCGGVLIGPRLVMTAAHCAEQFVEQPESLEVIVGRTRLSSSAGYRARVTAIILHPSYDYYVLRGDVALLRLDRDIPITPATLVGTDDIASVQEGDLATIIGWGQIDARFPILPDHLQEGSLTIQSDATCSHNLGLLYSPSNHLCAGDLGLTQDSCYGDSGGPLLVPNATGQVKVAGLVSWGFECASTRFYGVYTRVSSFKNWALSNPPVAPLMNSSPFIATADNGAAVGTELVCRPGSFVGEEVTYTYSWYASDSYVDVEEQLNPRYRLASSGGTLSIPQSLANKLVWCSVVIENRSGRSSGVSQAVQVMAEQPVATSDVTAPKIINAGGRCSHRKCTVDVVVFDAESSVQEVVGALSYKKKCSTGRSCSSAIRTEVLNAQTTGGSRELWRFHFDVKHPGSLSIRARATDSNGNQAIGPRFSLKVR